MQSQDVEIKDTDIFNLPEHIVYRQEDNGAFLFNTQNNNLKAVNETGRDIIELTNGEKTLTGIIDEMTSVYEDVARVRLEEDVRKFFKELTQYGFIEKKATSHE
ncbi:MAG: PqqD family protein [Candidatus Delongbacteria bacterium]|nr:PqqD family protein [Candidatus Delongbacteria bacterium]